MTSAEHAPIVAAVDGSANGLDGVRWAASAGSRQGRTVEIVSVVDEPVALHYGEEVNTAQAYTEASREFAETALEIAKSTALEVAPALPVDTAVLDGRPALVLRDLTGKAQTLVMGRRGLGEVEALLLGSVSADVSAHAQCPVVVVPENPTTTGPVVVGVDGSEISAGATVAAFAIADELDVDLIAVHSYVDAVPSLDLREEDKQSLVTAAQDLLDARLADLEKTYPNVTVDKVVSGNESASQILESADDAQLIVVGTRGLGGFTGMLIGSTSQAVLHAALCAVMVVPETN